VVVMPAASRRSLLSLTEVDTRTAYNSSTIERFNRASETAALIMKSPLLGSGVTAAGWAHTDLLQLAANLGIPAALLLLIGWYQPALFIFRRMRTQSAMSPIDHRSLLIQAGLLGASIASLVLLATEALIVISALVIPVWIVIGLLWAESAILRDEKKHIDARAQHSS
jgi:hypothetical protein